MSAYAQECNVEITVTFGASEDTWIEQANRLANHWPDPALHVAGNKERAVVQFNDVAYGILQATDRDGKLDPVILEAKLMLNLVGVDGGWSNDRIAAHLLHDRFHERKANWNCRSYMDCEDCCNVWRMNALAPHVTPSYVEQPSDTLTVSGTESGWVEIDVTSDVHNLVYGPEFRTSIGWILKSECECHEDVATIASCRSGTCPWLQVKLFIPCA